MIKQDKRKARLLFTPVVEHPPHASLSFVMSAGRAANGGEWDVN